MAAAKPYAMGITRGGRGHRSIDEYRWWKNCWEMRAVVLERPFDYDSFEMADFDQRGIIFRYGWTEYLKESGNTCNKTMCTEFLASLLPIANESYSYQSYIRNKVVLLNPTTLGAVMGIEPLAEGEFNFPYAEIPNDPTPDQLATRLAHRPLDWPRTHEGGYGLFDRNNLHDDYNVLWLLTCNCLMPTHQHQKINVSHARVMDAIIREESFCLVRFFIDQIASIYESNNTKEAIKLGVLITKLCDDAGVHAIPTDSQFRQLSTVDKRTMNRMRGQLRNRQAGEEEAESEEGPAGEGSSRGPTQAPRQKRKGASGAVPMDMDVLIGRFDEMQAMNQSHYTALDASHQQFRDRYNTDMGELNTGMKILGDRFLAMNTRMGLYEDRMGRFDNRMDAIEGRVGNIQQDLTTFREDVNTGMENIEDQLKKIMDHFQISPDV